MRIGVRLPDIPCTGDGIESDDFPARFPYTARDAPHRRLTDFSWLITVP